MRRGRDVELEQPEIPTEHRHRDVIDRNLADRSLERTGMGVPVQDEVGLVLGEGPR